MEPEAFDLIEILNRKGLPQTKPFKPLLHVEQPQEDVNIEDFSNFDVIYEKRLEKVEKKNAVKETLKKKEIERMTKVKQQPVPQPVQPLQPNLKRHLIFKSCSGIPPLELVDQGYKYRFPASTVPLVKNLLEENGFVEGGEESLIIWNVGIVSPSIYQSLGAYQKVNHFPKSFEITRKDLMLQNLSKMKSKHSAQYSFFPATYILPAETSQFLENEKGGEKWYIIKPNNKSQGKGIWLSNKPEEVIANYKETVVVSAYIHNPLLANGLKFDMRLYVGITCFNPLRIYLYEDGLTRFATTPYTFDLSSKENVYAHLTNYSLNKFAQNFEPNEDGDNCKGHKWSLRALREYLTAHGHDVATLWTRIEDVIVKTILSVQNAVFSATELGVPFRTNCFEVLGFDILIDQNLRPWLLEVNLSPSLNTDSTLDLKIKGSMLADLFTLVGVVGVDQQYNDSTHLTNANRLTANEYAKLEKIILRESEDELHRCGGWRRIFPNQTAMHYKNLFDVDRPLNRLLREEEIRKLKSRNPYISTQPRR